MAVSLNFALNMTATETLATGVPFINTGANTVTMSGLSTSGTLDATTTPAVTLDAFNQKAMSVGAGTIDLTACPGTGNTNVDFSSKRIIFVKFRNPGTNANAITVTFGASNAYLLNGSAFKYILNPGDEIAMYLKTTSVTVDATHKNIDISGTGSQALDYGFVGG